MPSNTVILDTHHVVDGMGMMLKVKINGLNEWRWRLAVGGWLIRLAAWVMWMDIEFITDGDK